MNTIGVEGGRVINISVCQQLRRGEGVLWHVLGLNAVEHVAVSFPVINWPAAFSYACIGAQFRFVSLGVFSSFKIPKKFTRFSVTSCMEH
jgi:hypothetical protein